LRRRGHTPIIATSACYRERIEALGLEFAPVRPDRDLSAPDPDLIDRVRRHWRSPAAVFEEMFLPRIEESYLDTLAATEGADLLVSHTLATTGRLIAEQTGIAWASAVMQPLGFFSGYDPPSIIWPAFAEGARRFGPTVTRPIMAALKAVVRPWNRPWHRLRAEIGLPPTRDDPTFEGQHSPALVLALFSRVLGQPQPDWPANVVVTGFPLFDDADHSLDPELEAFLAAGDPPVVFTLGTTAVREAGGFYQISAEAAVGAGRRAILLVGRDPRNRPTQLPEGVVAVEYAPYSALFPRGAAVVHQGGIGTTGRAMRAGKPMLIMPYGHDQPDNAARARRLGIARTISRRDFKVDRVAAELRRLLDEPRYAERATAISRELHAEDGTRNAVDAIEALLARHPRGARRGPAESIR